MSYRHIGFTKSLIDNIKSFTEKPDEIIISISEVNSQERTEHVRKLFSLQDTQDLNLKLFIFNDKKLSGENRNICMANASNDLLIFSDADDISHPDRCKIIKSIFETNQDIIHLTHGYLEIRKNDEVTSCPTLRHDVIRISKDQIIQKKRYEIEYPIQNGAISFLKNRIGNIKYKENIKNYIIAEDQDFNIEVLFSIDANWHWIEKPYYYRIGHNLSGI